MSAPSAGSAARVGDLQGPTHRILAWAITPCIARAILRCCSPKNDTNNERVFGTPHGADLGRLAAAAGRPAVTVDRAGDLLGALRGGYGIRVVEVRTSREAGTALRRKLREACTAAAASAG